MVDAFFAEYPAEWYRHHRATEEKDHAVVGEAMALLFSPRTAIDYGCATGNVLAAIRSVRGRGVLVRGVDAPHLTAFFGPSGGSVEPALPAEYFVSYDLRELNGGIPAWAWPPSRDRWDLGICTELAEHVPEETGRRVVKLLAATTSRVLWSAAVPGQGGTGHITERPREFWQEVFAENGWVRDAVAEPYVARYVARTSWAGRLQVYHPERRA
jgi:hypothetical protein